MSAVKTTIQLDRWTQVYRQGFRRVVLIEGDARVEVSLDDLRHLLAQAERMAEESAGARTARLRTHSPSEPVVEGYVPNHWRETLDEYPSAIIGFVADLSDHDAEVEKWVRVELRPIGQPIDSGEGER